MALNPPRSMRTIHNGSNGVAKVSLVIPAGADLSVSDELAAQFGTAFKDGPAPQALLDALARDDAPELPEPVTAAPTPTKQSSKAKKLA